MAGFYQRKLEALDFPNRDNFRVQDGKEFRRLVSWLEDTKIRFLPIEEREPLRKIEEESIQWNKYFFEYLTKLKCPRTYSDKMSESELALVLDWLLGYALTLEYRDSLQSNQDTTALLKQQTLEDKKIEDKTDYNSPEFKNAVYSLASTLKIPTDEQIDIKIILKSILEIVEKKFTEERLKGNTINNNNNTTQTTTTKLDAETITQDRFPLGFDTGDDHLNKAATVLRMLYIDDLRQLQTKINELIVLVQNYTANPKTDTSLGRVGK